MSEKNVKKLMRSRDEELALFESRSASQTSSGSLKFFLYIRKLVGTPMIYGVGTRSN